MTPRRTARSRSSANQSQESSESMQTRRSRRRRNIDDEEMEGDNENGEEEMGNEEMNDDEEPSEVTRCICGHAELQTNHISKGQASEIDPGLFIQCDKCQVWQHGFCVGFISEDEVPDVYFCEKCRPELHIVVQRPWGKTSRYVPHLKAKGEELHEEEDDDDDEQDEQEQTEREIKRERRGSIGRRSRGAGSAAADEKRQATSRTASPVTAERSSRRRTLNSRDAQYEDILKRVLEESVQELKGSGEDGSFVDNDQQEGEERTGVKQQSGRSSGSSGTASRQPEKENAEDIPVTRKRSDRDESSEDVSSSKSRRTARSVVSRTPVKRDSEKSGRGSAAMATEETDTKTSAPDDDTSGASSKKKSKRTRSSRPTKTASVQKYNNDRAKPRIPQPRSTVEEMQKRVAAILEFISRTQIDIANEQSERNQLLDERTNRYRELFSSDDTSQNFQGLITAYKVSLESMDTLTKKLVDWEQQFGHYSDEASVE
jgi:PHD-finger